MNLSKFIPAIIQTPLILLLLCYNIYAGNIMPVDIYSFWVSTNAADVLPPVLRGCAPEADAIAISRSTNIKTCIFDTQSAIDPGSINMSVNNVPIIIQGSAQTYQDANGNTCIYQVEIVEKTVNEYILMYDPTECFNYEQIVLVSISAADIYGNNISGYNYSFKIQDFQIGSVNSFFNPDAVIATGVLNPQATDTGFLQDNAVIANSADGKYVFIAWEQRSSLGIWDIYCVRSNDFGKTFTAPIKVNPDAAKAEQRFPDIALDSMNNIYISWQQKAAAGDWDIYIARMESNVNSFSKSKCIYADDKATNQLSPAIAVGPALSSDGQSWTQEPPTIYVVWIEDNGLTSNLRYTRTTADYSDAWDTFVSSSIRIDGERAQQCKDPIIKLDASSRIFAAWRGQNADGTASIYFDLANKSTIDGGEIFGADFTVSNNTSALTAPKMEVSLDGNNICLLWKELAQTQSNLKFSYYRYSNGYYNLNANKIVNSNALNEQDLGSYGLSLDNRGDASVIWSQLKDNNRQLYIAGAAYNESEFREFACISTSGAQNNPCLSVGALGGHYYIGWTDNSNGYNAVYFCRNTYIVTDEITMQKIDNDSGGSVMVTQGSINGTSIEIPANAIDAPITITIAESVGAPDTGPGITFTKNIVDFGPGQMVFNKPVRITLPYNNTLSDLTAINENNLKIFYYNIGALDWEAVPDCQVDTVSKTVSSNISHFSIYMVAAETTQDTAAVPEQGGGGGGGCFIATAAFGTSTAKDVKVLREFRDQYLLTNKLGIWFVRNYYKYGPAFADKIRDNENARTIVRVCLKPLIWLSRKIVHRGQMVKLLPKARTALG